MAPYSHVISILSKAYFKLHVLIYLSRKFNNTFFRSGAIAGREEAVLQTVALSFKERGHAPIME